MKREPHIYTPAHDLRSSPICATCGCGGNWHYRECEVAQKRGDTHFLVRGGLADECANKRAVLFPLMTQPCRPVEKEKAESYMRGLLDRTIATLRGNRDG